MQYIESEPQSYKKSEFYVVNLVRSDDEASRLVAGFIGLDPSLTREQIANALANPETIRNAMLRLGVVVDFERLHHYLDLEQRITKPIEPLTNSNFQWLLDVFDGRKIAADLLGCGTDEVIQKLFPPDGLAELLINAEVVNREDPHCAESEWLLRKFLSERSQRRLQIFLGGFNKWDLLQRDLLDNDACEILSGALDDCPKEAVLQHLIAHIEKETQIRGTTKADPDRDFGDGLGVDIIGLSVLRRYLHIFQYDLLEQARYRADTSRKRLPGYRIPEVLPVLLRFYGTKEFKLALEDLLRSEQPLRLMVDLDDVMLAADEEIPPEARLEVIAKEDVLAQQEEGIPSEIEAQQGHPLDASAEVNPADKVDVVIRCDPQSVTPPKDILQLFDLTRDELRHIQKNLPNQVDDLYPVGDTVQERVLNTSLPLFSEWRKKLLKIISSLDDTQTTDNVLDPFVQYFVLSGASLRPETIPDLEVSDYLGKADASPSDQVEFLKNAQDIAASLSEQYVAVGKRLKLVNA